MRNKLDRIDNCDTTKTTRAFYLKKTTKKNATLHIPKIFKKKKEQKGNLATLQLTHQTTIRRKIHVNLERFVAKSVYFVEILMMY